MKIQNKTKKGWITSKNLIPTDFYSLTETVEILKVDDYYKSLLGKSKNRTLIKNNPKLYNSIYKHTECLNNFNKNNNKFSIRILFLVKDFGDIEKIKCKLCLNNHTSFNYEKEYFNEVCLDCFHTKKIKYPTIGWFKNKYGENWEIFYKKDRDSLKKESVGSKEWYIKKYGKNDGLKHYHKIKEKRVNNLKTLVGIRYSKISQEIFWKIYEELNENEREKCYFKELNNEFFIKNTESIFFVDFKCGDKVIEYDGEYWHKNRAEIDKIRNNIYEKKGLKLMIINEKDYNRSNKNIETIKKCVFFIRNEN